MPRHPGEGRGAAAAKPPGKNLDSGLRRNDGVDVLNANRGRSESATSVSTAYPANPATIRPGSSGPS